MSIPLLLSHSPHVWILIRFYLSSLNMSLLLHATLGTSGTHLEYHHCGSSILRIETRELLVLFKSEFQMAVVSCTVALEVGLKQQV